MLNYVVKCIKAHKLITPRDQKKWDFYIVCNVRNIIYKIVFTPLPPLELVIDTRLLRV